jgi:ABC-type Fe3+-hydroxamate transport system substrate-binding protein
LVATLVSWAILASGCDGEAPERPAEADRTVAVASLSRLATRFVLAVGAGHQLVAIDAASADIEGVDGLPVTDLAGVAATEPDIVLVPADPDPRDPDVAALLQRGARIATFAPHDFEDVLALVREVGREIVGTERATRFEVALSRPLAKIGGASRGQPRPRVVAVVRFDPIVIAGGHSFETDLIEIAGGHSVTHPGETTRRVIRADEWASLSPDLVLVLGERPDARTEQAWRNVLPEGAAVVFVPLDSAFWLEDPTEPALRLRARVAPIAERLRR